MACRWRCCNSPWQPQTDIPHLDAGERLRLGCMRAHLVLKVPDGREAWEELVLDLDPRENLAVKFARSLNHRPALVLRWMQSCRARIKRQRSPTIHQSKVPDRRKDTHCCSSSCSPIDSSSVICMSPLTFPIFSVPSCSFFAASAASSRQTCLVMSRARPGLKAPAWARLWTLGGLGPAFLQGQAQALGEGSAWLGLGPGPGLSHVSGIFNKGSNTVQIGTKYG
ncbi:hypothetical protein B0H14DRAFT_2575472 [Mycena olivaceomarginata]|nr:hypothetical protein B0H14DRAFT_2575472 [Mycena olivaceomarginata]